MKGDFSMVPFALTLQALRLGLSATDLVVLQFHAATTNRATKRASWQQASIAERIGCSVRSVERAEGRLEQRGLVRMHRVGRHREVEVLELEPAWLADRPTPDNAVGSDAPTPDNVVGCPEAIPDRSVENTRQICRKYPTDLSDIPDLVPEQEPETGRQSAGARAHAHDEPPASPPPPPAPPPRPPRPVHSGVARDVDAALEGWDLVCRRHPALVARGKLRPLGLQAPDEVRRRIAEALEKWGGIETWLAATEALVTATDEAVERTRISTVLHLCSTSGNRPELGAWCWRLAQGDPTVRWDDSSPLRRDKRRSATAPPEARASPVPSPLVEADQGWLRWLEGSLLVAGTPPADAIRTWWARHRQHWNQTPGQLERLDRYVEQLAQASTTPGQDGRGATTTDGR